MNFIVAASAAADAFGEMKRALVTGGAGLIGSHIVDLLVREGWQVRALDNLEPNTHRRGKPSWINERTEFIDGDMRDRDTVARYVAAAEQLGLVVQPSCASTRSDTLPSTLVSVPELLTL